MVRKANQKSITEEGDRYIRENYRRQTYADMAAHLDLSIKQVQHAMKRMGLRKEVWGIRHYKEKVLSYENTMIHIRGVLTRKSVTKADLEDVIRTIDKTLDE